MVLIFVCSAKILGAQPWRFSKGGSHDLGITVLLMKESLSVGLDQRGHQCSAVRIVIPLFENHEGWGTQCYRPETGTRQKGWATRLTTSTATVPPASFK
jgi:hypothetical protein